MKLTNQSLKKIVHAALHTRSDEIGCDSCFDQINQFAEMKLQGKTPDKALLLVKDHLKRCNNCQEEYEALLEALKNI